MCKRAGEVILSGSVVRDVTKTPRERCTAHELCTPNAKTLNPEPGTWDQKPESLKPKPSELGTLNPKPEFRGAWGLVPDALRARAETSELATPFRAKTLEFVATRVGKDAFVNQLVVLVERAQV